VLNHRFQPRSSYYKSLRAAALKDVIIYARNTGDIELCIDIRENIMLIGSLNLLIVDEHDAFWQKLGNDPNKWPSFLRLMHIQYHILLSIVNLLSQRRSFTSSSYLVDIEIPRSILNR
jgi:hypothetical protein